MTELREGKGHCLCGSVKVNVKNLNQQTGACHCDMCRRWGGGPLMAVDCGSEVTFEGDDQISVFDSSDWAERGFLPTVRNAFVLSAQREGVNTFSRRGYVPEPRIRF